MKNKRFLLITIIILSVFFISEMSCSNQPVTAADQPVSAADQSVSAADQPVSATEQLVSASEQTPPVTEISEPENSPLYWGNPSGAVCDLNYRTNYLMVKKQFSLSYNAEKLIPNWVMWHLNAGDFGESVRRNDFRADRTLPDGWYAVLKSDYQFADYGFDRGHLCPSADRSDSNENNSATFLMTNMMPQAPDCNRIVWKNLESYERRLIYHGKELYIAAGPAGQGGTGARGYFKSIRLRARKKAVFTGHEITVPAYCWKIILVLDEGNDDFNRVTAETPVIAVWMPNAQGIGETGSWEQYITTVDLIEEKTDYDFFSVIPDNIEDALESKLYHADPEF